MNPKLKINILTIFPEFFDSFKNTSIIKKALLKEEVEINCFNIRDFSKSKTKRVDDHPLGGGAGLVMSLQPIMDCLRANNLMDSYKILVSPEGQTFKQSKARILAKKSNITFLCGHYEGIDSRIKNYVDDIISLGDFIVTGGEVITSVICDSIIRLVPGVINYESLSSESFDNDLLEYDQYTYPINYEGHIAPEYLLSGNHELVDNKRLLDSLLKTKEKRPDLFKKHIFSKNEIKLLQKYEEDKDK